MRRFWQFIPIPPRQWLARFGLLVVLFLILILAGGRELVAPEPKPAEIAICGQPNKWLALIDQYLGTKFATAQGGPCATLTAQCQGPFDAYPGFKLSWDSLELIPSSWKAQVVSPGAEVSGQAAGPGFAEWNTVNPRATDPPLLTQVDSAGNAINDNTYYRAAVQYVATGRARCSGEWPGENKYPNQCEVIRTRDFTDDPDLRYGGPSRVVPVTAEGCLWQQSETPPLANIPCGRTVLHTSALNSIRGGTTEWGIIGVELCGGSFPCQAGEPTLTSNRSSPPLLYEGDFSDGSTVKLWMQNNQVIAERSSPSGGVCRPIPAMTCSLRIDGVANASWQSDPDGPFPNLTWDTTEFADNDDTITVTEYDAAGSPTGRTASWNQASGGPVSMFSSPLEGRFRVRPSDPAKTFRYIGQVDDTGAPNGPDRFAAGSCEAQLTITRELIPNPPADSTCVGGCSPTPSCNAVTISWSAVPNAKLYRVYVGDASGRFIPSIIPNPVPVTPPATTVSIPVPQGPASYKFALQTVDQSENASALSSPISADVPACTGSFPTPPNLTVSAGPSCDTMRLNWTDAGSETGYEVWRKRVSPPADAGFTKIADLAANILTYLDSGLSGSASYSYYVVANAPGGSATSNTDTHATDPCSGSDFRVDATPDGGVTVRPGETANYTVTIIPSNLPNTDINLSVTGLPAGATVTFGANPLRTPASGNVQTAMSIATAPGTPGNTYPLTVYGSTTGGSPIVRTDTVNLVVDARGPNNPPSVSGGPPTTGLMCSFPPLLTFEFTYTDPDTPPDNAERFTFQVARDSAFAQVVVDRPDVPSSVASGSTITQLVEVCSGCGALGSGKLAYGQTYYWRAKAWDSRGAESAWMNGVQFASPNHAYPQPDFAASVTTITPGTPIDFTDQSIIASGYSIARWLWNFGSDVQSATVAPPPNQPADQDGNPNNNTVTQSPPPIRTQPHVTYGVAGAKTVSLSVRDSAGLECTRTKALFGGSGVNLNWREVIPQ